MNPYLYYAAVTFAAACIVTPIVLRSIALRRIEVLMSDFCRAPTRAKASHIEHLLGRYGVYGCEIDRVLYTRWLNVRLAMDRINVFRRSKEP